MALVCARFGIRLLGRIRAMTLLACLLSVPALLPAFSTSAAENPINGTSVDDKLQALVDVLEDEKARALLIDRLNALAAKEETPAPPLQDSVVRQFAEITRDAAEEASLLVSRMGSDIRGLGDYLRSGSLDFGAMIEVNVGLIGVVAVVFLALILLRLPLRFLTGRIAEKATNASMLEAAFWLIGVFLLGALAVLIAFGAGHGMALGAFGASGRIGVDQSLFLNAFLFVEFAKTALRALISPRFATLRFLPIGDAAAGFAYRRSAWIISILGYGILVAVPLAMSGISPTLGRALSVLILITALALTLFGIRKLKSLLAADATSNGAEADLTGRALLIFDRIWPWLVSAYAVGVFAVAVSRPSAVLPFVLGATAWSALAIAAGVGLVVLIGRWIEKGVPLPTAVRSDMPRLGRRLDAAVPAFLRTVRLIVLIAVALILIDAWGLIDVGGWLTSDSGDIMLGTVASVAFVLMIAWLAWLACMSWIEYRLSDTRGRDHGDPGYRGHVAGARERTLLSLFGNAVTIVVAVIAGMLALSELGIDIGPLLAGAGVVGLAIGFGAQKLVQDIITGVFIQFENALNTGDVVTVAGTTGEVERLSIRSIGIRDVAGTYHLIPFSAVDQVSNFNRGFAYHVADIGIAYKESVPEAKEAMQVAFERLKEGHLDLFLLGDLEMHGVNALGDSAVVLRARLRTAPGRQWAVGRAYNELVKEVFDERGIDIPFPHMTVFMGTDKDGRTQLDGIVANPA